MLILTVVFTLLQFAPSHAFVYHSQHLLFCVIGVCLFTFVDRSRKSEHTISTQPLCVFLGIKKKNDYYIQSGVCLVSSVAFCSLWGGEVYSVVSGTIYAVVLVVAATCTDEGTREAQRYLSCLEEVLEETIGYGFLNAIALFLLVLVPYVKFSS
jgi:hypothetical protein